MPFEINAAYMNVNDNGQYIPLPGLKGDKGDKGDTGPQGVQGPQGVKGDTGATGPQGHQGVQGPKGDTGTGFTITDYVTDSSSLPASPAVGTAYGVGTAAPYDIYVYTASGTWVNNGPIQGPQGEQGEQGIQGIQGPAGPQGPQGIQGERGVQGETGPAGPQGPQGIQGPVGPQGPKGDGIGGGTFSPLVYIGPTEPSTPVENEVWIVFASVVTAGEVILGYETTLPSYRPNGDALVNGDVYVITRGKNNHPVVWGNVTLYPVACYLRNNGAWVRCQSYNYSSGEWYKSGVWIIENGVIVGTAIIPTNTSSAAYFTVETLNSELVLTPVCGNSTAYYLYATFGDEVAIGNYPFKVYVEGAITSGNEYATTLGAAPKSDAGVYTKSLSTVSANYTISAGATGTNPEYNASSTGGASSVCPALRYMYRNTSSGGVAKIKNMYYAFTANVPTV